MNIDDLMLLPETKERAIISGSEFYFTGKKCKRGHFSKRYTSSANCVQCIDELKKRGERLTKGKPRASYENRKLAKQAIESGFTTYTPVNPCRNGHRIRFAESHNCVECCNAKQKTDSDDKRWRRIMTVYNLSKERFFEILSNQENCCAICRAELTVEKSHIDHCHVSGIVRGILCSRCNQGIGLFRESKEIMLSAIKYLE